MAANGGGSIPATPQMMAAQPNTRQWVRAWVESIEGEMQEQAEELTLTAHMYLPRWYEIAQFYLLSSGSRTRYQLGIEQLRQI